MGGPFQLGTGTTIAEFTDGLSNTLLVGEKQVPVSFHGIGWLDCSTYNGDYHMCSTRAAREIPRPITTDPHSKEWKFGSRHPGVVLFCFGDGHVRSLPETIDPHTFFLLGKRNDGLLIPDY